MSPIKISVKNLGVNIVTGIAGKTTPLDVFQNVQCYHHPFGVIVNGDDLWNIRKPFVRDSIIRFFIIQDQKQYNRHLQEYEARTRAERYHGNGFGILNKINPCYIQAAVCNGNGMIINAKAKAITPSWIVENYYRHLGITEHSSVVKVNGQIWNFHRPLEDFSIIDFTDKESWLQECTRRQKRMRQPNQNIDFADLPESSKSIRIAIICDYVFMRDALKTTPLDIVRFVSTTYVNAENVTVKVNNENWPPLRPFERNSTLDFEIKNTEHCTGEKWFEVTEYEISMVKHGIECQFLLNQRKLEHCSIPNCFKFKYILNHMVLCDDQNLCTLYGCAKAKFILRWMKTCKDEACLNIGKLPGFSLPHQRQIAPTDQNQLLSARSYANNNTSGAEQNISHQAPLPRHEIPNHISAAQVGVPSLQTPMNMYSMNTLNLVFSDQVSLPSGEGTNQLLTMVDNIPNKTDTLAPISSQALNTNEDRSYQESDSFDFFSHQARSFGVHNQTSLTDICSRVSSSSEGSNQASNIVPYASNISGIIGNPDQIIGNPDQLQPHLDRIPNIPSEPAYDSQRWR